MKIPGYRRLFSTDFKEKERDFVDRLGNPINAAFDTLHSALNGNITLSDNVACTVKDVTVRVDSSGIPLANTTFRLNSNQPVTMVVCGNAVNQTNPSGYVLGAPFISWTQTQNGIVINHITGLRPNDTYILRVVAYI